MLQAWGDAGYFSGLTSVAPTLESCQTGTAHFHVNQFISPSSLFPRLVSANDVIQAEHEKALAGWYRHSSATAFDDNANNYQQPYGGSCGPSGASPK